VAARNIIFDFGGVLLNIDYQKTTNAFEKLGGNNFKNLYSASHQTELFDRFEIGEITSEEFLKEIRGLLKINDVSTRKLMKAWTAMLISFPKQNFLLLKELAKTYNLYILSNTNEIHVSAFKKMIEKNCPLFEFKNLFKEIYWSCEIHCRKPDSACFLSVINDNKLNPKETIFIDDSLQNIKAAQKIGITSCLLKRNGNVDFLLTNALFKRSTLIK